MSTEPVVSVEEVAKYAKVSPPIRCIRGIQFMRTRITPSWCWYGNLVSE